MPLPKLPTERPGVTLTIPRHTVPVLSRILRALGYGPVAERLDAARIVLTGPPYVVAVRVSRAVASDLAELLRDTPALAEAVHAGTHPVRLQVDDDDDQAADVARAPDPEVDA